MTNNEAERLRQLYYSIMDTYEGITGNDSHDLGCRHGLFMAATKVYELLTADDVEQELSPEDKRNLDSQEADFEERRERL